MNTVLIVAHKEFRDGLRNRWAFAITVIFALFALGLAYFGAAASGQVGFTSLATTIVSLASLAIFLIPLIALLLAYDSIVGEESRGGSVDLGGLGGLGTRHSALGTRGGGVFVSLRGAAGVV